MARVKYNDGDGYRIAIVGIGAIANMHAKAIGDIEGATVVAGSCRTRPKGEHFAEQYNCTWYRDNEEMLDKEKPDVVSICSPSGAHLFPVLECFNRSIHVICEKPLEISLERIQQMIDAAKAAPQQPTYFGGIFPQRFNPVVQLLHEACAEGRFGRLSTASSYVPWWRDDQYYSPNRWQGTQELDGGGAMMNQSIHGVDMIQWLVSAAMQAEMGENYDAKQNPVEEVFAYTGQLGHDPETIEVEDTAVTCVKFRNGTLGQFLGTTSMYPGTLKRVLIGGRGGTAEIVEDELTKFSFGDGRDADQAAREQFGKATKTGGGASDPMAIDYANHTRNIKAFLDAVDKREPFALDGHEASKAVAIIEAIYESAKTGQPASVKQLPPG